MVIAQTRLEAFSALAKKGTTTWVLVSTTYCPDDIAIQLSKTKMVKQQLQAGRSTKVECSKF